MSYLAFHLVFVVPPILLLAAGVRGRLVRLDPRAGVYLALIAGIAFLYTTPWDNYLVWRGVWSYGPGRVVGTVGYVPLEEYAFFLLQPLLTGLWLYRVLLSGPGGAPPRRSAPAVGRRPSAAAPAAPRSERTTGRRQPAADSRGGAGRRGGVGSGAAARWIGALLYAAAAAYGAWLLQRPWGTYLGLILVWAAPVLMLQWAYAGGEIWARRRTWLLGVVPPTLYLWVADAVAIRLGIWSIAEPFTTRIFLLGLPLEEAVFFLVTNLLVVQGLMLFLYPPRRAGRRSSVVGRRPDAGPSEWGGGGPTAGDRRPTTGRARKGGAR